MNIWRVAGVALVAGLALFLISLLVKMLLIVVATGLVIRVVGGRLMGRFAGPAERVGWSSTGIISIDNPNFQSPMKQAGFARIIPIS